MSYLMGGLESLEIDSSQEYLAGHQAKAKRKKLEINSRRSRALEISRLVADELVKEFPVEKIYLFGSLATGGFGLYSDIDLSVQGLNEKLHYKALAFAQKLAAPFPVDLVRIEEAGPSLRKKIQSEGVILFG
jgi:predicted nucleotidyltransferase